MPFTDSEKAHIVAKCIETGSITTTRRWIGTSMRITPRTWNIILLLHEKFLTAGNMAHTGGNGRPRISDGEIENVRSLFENNPRLSISQAESLLNMPLSTIQHVFRKCLFLYPYKMYNLHGISNTDMRKRVILARHCQNQHEGIFHQDGASAHYSSRVRTYLDNKRPGNWIGRGGPVEWPPRWPDLTPCDYFLWGHLKEKV